jgi:hypothetical protein
MPALATSRIMSASQARGVGAGVPVQARFNLAGTPIPVKLNMLSAGSPPPAPPARGAVEAPPAATGGPGPGARGTADMAGAACDEQRTGSGAHGGEWTHRQHRPWRGRRTGHLKRCIVAAPIFAHNHVGRTTRAPQVTVNGLGRDGNTAL